MHEAAMSVPSEFKPAAPDTRANTDTQLVTL